MLKHGLPSVVLLVKRFSSNSAVFVLHFIFLVSFVTGA